MKLTKIACLALVLSFVVSCASHKSNLIPALQVELDKPLICSGDKQCKIMWERAHYFISINAGFEIQIKNNMTLQTYGPSEGSEMLAFSITKEPLDEGQYRIWTAVACDDFYGCDAKKYEMIAQAKYYIRFGQNY